MELQWSTHQASGVGGGVLEPWASSDFLGKFWENPELAANPGGHLPEIQGIQGILHHQTASIIRGCTNHARRTVSCDSAACED